MRTTPGEEEEEEEGGEGTALLASSKPEARAAGDGEVGLCTTAFAVASWFALNISIASVNKWVISVDHFEYPALLTVVHMVCSYALSILAIATCLRPAMPVAPSAETLSKVRRLSLTFCGSVFCGNLALKFVWVSFAQMVTAASPLLTLLLAKLLTDKQFSRLAHLSMLPMCGGVMFCVVGELRVSSGRAFSWVGLGLIVLSTALRGVKSIMQGALLSGVEDKLDALSLLQHMSKYSVALLTLYALLTGEVHACYADTRVHTPRVAATVAASGAIAFLLNVCNFLVTKYTSAVTLQVLGNVKVVLSIGISLLIFGNELSPVSALGCLVTLGGVWLYERGMRSKH
ncbi:triose-phosphate transporter family-domain-containing protein [Pavlovales sp. CCMP2436]|nr:triose-phosphate transporter family-domain-containing protein [Pavlovales sp. CCMP2436]|mmetsp:Transcript_21674/g.54990  ORF Transcript_21674/g.54990 Transcript_21674/m.54990 type:complete len:344 (+) Transcript_21674:127-1158(+)